MPFTIPQMHASSLVFVLFVVTAFGSPLVNKPTLTEIAGPLITAIPPATTTPPRVVFTADIAQPVPAITAPTTLVSDLSPSSPTYTAIALQHHNVHRANHSAPNMAWSGNLAVYAQQKATSCVFDESIPSGAGSVGMNLALGTNIVPGALAVAISELWYNGEINNYPGYGVDSPSMANFENWGHFSQVVWKSSTQTGCYTAYCPQSVIGTAWMTACLYSPPGNFGGQYTQVGSPLGHPAVKVIGNTVVGLTGVNAGY